MALAVSALTNNGVRPAPRIVISYEDPDETWIALPKLGENHQALSSEIAEKVTSFLKVPDSSTWQVTARAFSEDDKPISWFVAGTTIDWQGQPLVVVTILETDDPEIAQNIGISLIDMAMH